jgi:hypothetical protein
MRRTKETPKRIAYRYLLKPGLWAIDVPLKDGESVQKVTVRLSTWNKLMDMGLYPYLNVDVNRYVTVWSPTYRTWKRLARLIANCNSDQQVSIKDGNELNLLEDNILVIDRDLVTWDREQFLTTDGGLYHNEIECRLKDNKTDHEIIKASITR